MEPTLIVADRTHINIHMMAEIMRAGVILDQAALDAKRDAVIAGMNSWAARNGVELRWSDKAGRRTKGRHYRVAYDAMNDSAGLERTLALLDTQIAWLIANRGEK